MKMQPICDPYEAKLKEARDRANLAEEAVMAMNRTAIDQRLIGHGDGQREERASIIASLREDPALLDEIINAVEGDDSQEDARAIRTAIADYLERK